MRFRNQHVCGAAILSQRHCLTAAHCFQPRTLQNQYSVIVGSNTVSGRDRGAFQTSILRFILHNQYDPRTYRNDIAVLQLQNQLPLNRQTIIAIGLPAHNQLLPIGRSGKVSGW